MHLKSYKKNGWLVCYIQEINKKFFAYWNKKYPFIYDLLNRNFFYINRKVYKNIDEKKKDDEIINQEKKNKKKLLGMK